MDEDADNNKNIATLSIEELPDEPPVSLLRRTLTFLAMIVCLTVINLYYTVSLPFLADEVIERRGFSATIAGTIFGVQCLSLFLTLLSAPKTSALLSFNKTLLFATSLELVSTIFYLLDLSNTEWVIYTIISRMLQGAAMGLTDVRFIGLMSQCFANKLSLVSSTYELAFCAAMIIGSNLGGQLYEASGFWLPMNLVTLLVVIGNIMAAVSYNMLSSKETVAEMDSMVTFRDVLHWPIIVLSFGVMSIVSIVATIAESFFSNYMFQEFNTTESKSGALLSLAAGFYTIATLLSGVLGTQNKNFKYLLTFGLLIMGSSSCLMETELLPDFSNIGIYFPAGVLCGMQVGSGLCQIAVLPLLVVHYQNVTSLSEEVSSCHMGGIYSSFYFLGSFIGPMFGGFIISHTSYTTCCLMGGILLLCSLFVVLSLHLNTRTLLNPWIGTVHTRLL